MSSTTISDSILKLISLDELDEEKRNRSNLLIEQFQKCTNTKPDYIICTPGRVNIIGDHVDYHGFAVLPMAINKTIWFACSFNQNKGPQDGDCQDTSTRSRLNLINVDGSDYLSFNELHSFSHGLRLNNSHKWQNYILCAYYGILAKEFLKIDPKCILKHSEELESNKQILQEADKLLNRLNNLTILVDSDLPKASGLSSSSALVCSSAVATSLLLTTSSHLDDQSHKLMQLDGTVLADCCSKFEHLIGTQGGGMDQAVIMTAQHGYAKYVEFIPKLNCENVHLPSDIVWLISHCGVSHAKAVTANFNTRVLETKLGAALIVKFASKTDTCLNDIELNSSITLSRVKDELFKGMSTPDLVDHIRKEVFDEKEEFTLDEICAKLELTQSELIKRFLISEDIIAKSTNDKFRVLSRCEHVFEEAERVEKFKSICDTTVDIGLLGQLMTQSHYSLRDKYNCSHPALDRLVGVALDAGALGCRLTGAGWGGCVVTMVETSKSSTVFDRLQEVSEFTFRSEPESGCRIIKVQN